MPATKLEAQTGGTVPQEDGLLQFLRVEWLTLDDVEEGPRQRTDPHQEAEGLDIDVGHEKAMVGELLDEPQDLIDDGIAMGVAFPPQLEVGEHHGAVAGQRGERRPGVPLGAQRLQQPAAKHRGIGAAAFRRRESVDVLPVDVGAGNPTAQGRFSGVSLTHHQQGAAVPLLVAPYRGGCPLEGFPSAHPVLLADGLFAGE